MASSTGLNASRRKQAPRRVFLPRARAVLIALLTLSSLIQAGPATAGPTDDSTLPQIVVRADGTPQTARMSAGTWRIIAEGTWRDGPAPTDLADAECAFSGGDLRWRRDAQGLDAAGDDLGDLLVDGVSVEWVPLEPTPLGCSDGAHSFETFLTLAEQRSVPFRILDDDYADNLGALTVTLTKNTLLEAPSRTEPRAFVGTVVIDASKPDAASVPVRLGERHLFLVRGIYRYGQGSYADAECSDSVIEPMDWRRERYGSHSLDLLMSGEDVDWKPLAPASPDLSDRSNAGCSVPTHGYTLDRKIPASGYVDFTIKDTSYWDNEGMLFVSAFMKSRESDSGSLPLNTSSTSTLSVPASGATVTSGTLNAGTYLVRAVGTWQYGDHRLALADAVCARTVASHAWTRAPFGGTAGTLTMNGDAVAWMPDEATRKACDETTSIYETYLQMDRQGTASFAIADDGNGEANVGALSVSILRVTGASLSDNRAPLAYLGTLTLDSTTGSTESIDVRPGERYLTVARGRYRFADDGSEADAECSEAHNSGDGVWRRDRFSPESKLDLLVLNKPVEWSPSGCQARTSSFYAEHRVSKTSFLDVRLNDPTLHDNEGTLFVAVFRMPRPKETGRLPFNESRVTGGSTDQATFLSSPLPTGTYRVRARGSWRTGADPLERGDAMCAQTPGDHIWRREALAGEVLLVDGGPAEWVPSVATRFGCDEETHNYDTWINVEDPNARVELTIPGAPTEIELSADFYRLTGTNLSDKRGPHAAVGTILVDASDLDGASIALRERERYVVLGHGRYSFATDGSEADVDCSEAHATGDASWKRNRFEQESLLDVTVAGKAVDWTPSNCRATTNTYAYELHAAPALVNFRVNDLAHYDNEGFLFMALFRMPRLVDQAGSSGNFFSGGGNSNAYPLVESSQSTVTVPVGPGVATPVLQKGIYRLRARGTWRYGADADARADAVCAAIGAPMWERESFGSSAGTLTVDGATPQWIPTEPTYKGCDEETHTYDAFIELDQARSIALSIDDDGDASPNEGNLSVELMRVTGTNVAGESRAPQSLEGTIRVDTNKGSGTIVALDPDQTYVYLVNGRYRFSSDGSEADAECSEGYLTGDRSWKTARFSPEEMLDLRVNREAVTWAPGACRPTSHSYWLTHAIRNKTHVEFAINDTSYWDNRGELFVTIFKLPGDLVSTPISSDEDDLISSISVPGDGTSAATPTLNPGTYRIVATGTLTGPSGDVADAECVTKTTDPIARRERPHQADPDLLIDGGSVDWVAANGSIYGCDDTHTYDTFLTVSVAAPLTFSVAGGGPTSGALTVDVYLVTSDTLPRSIRSYYGTVEVSSRFSQGVTFNLPPESTYLFVARGKYWFSGNWFADAECAQGERDAYGAGPLNDLLDLQVDKLPTDWEPVDGCQSYSHTYWLEREGGGEVNLSILDGSYNDNLGSLFVQIFVIPPGSSLPFLG